MNVIGVIVAAAIIGAIVFTIWRSAQGNTSTSGGKAGTPSQSPKGNQP
jgi:hypothetical protein